MLCFFSRVMDKIFKQAKKHEKRIREYRNIVLADLVMIGEIPAPTFSERYKKELVSERFTASNVDDCVSDEMGNVFGLIKGEEEAKTVLLIAHLDTVFPQKIDHTVSIRQNMVTGVGLADNSLGVTVLTTLPLILERLSLKFRTNILLMASSHSLGRGNLEGIQYFLKNPFMPIDYAICVEGHRLGRLSYSSIGMLQGEIRYSLPEEYDWTKFGAESAIVNINDVINKILEIPQPKRPRSTIVLNAIESGAAFSIVPTQATLQLEVRSESATMVQSLERKIRNVCVEVAASSGGEVKFYEIARRAPGGISFLHPLVHVAQATMDALEIPSRLSPSTSELAACIAHQIPAITIGMTFAKKYNEVNEQVMIEPLSQGIAQLITIISAIDEGYCDDE